MSKTIYEIVKESPNHMVLHALIVKLNLVRALSSHKEDHHLYLHAPTDAAFAKLKKIPTQVELKKILQHHVHVITSDEKHHQSKHTVKASNGYVHVIDHVLLPSHKTK